MSGWLVTGAGGMLGRDLVTALRGRGEEVAGLARDDAGSGPGGDQPDQNQCHQRLFGFTGVDELVHPRHQALPGPAESRVDLSCWRDYYADQTSTWRSGSVIQSLQDPI